MSTPPLLSVGSFGGDTLIAWSGIGEPVLQEASRVSGPYTAVVGATNPLRVTPIAGQAKFYRVLRP